MKLVTGNPCENIVCKYRHIGILDFGCYKKQIYLGFYITIYIKTIICILNYILTYLLTYLLHGAESFLRS